MHCSLACKYLLWYALHSFIPNYYMWLLNIVCFIVSVRIAVIECEMFEICNAKHGSLVFVSTLSVVICTVEIFMILVLKIGMNKEYVRNCEKRHWNYIVLFWIKLSWKKTEKWRNWEQWNLWKSALKIAEIITDSLSENMETANK